MLSTSLGLVPLVVVFAAIAGTVVGYLGGSVGKRWPGAPPATTRPIEPMQPASDADESSVTRRTLSAARG